MHFQVRTDNHIKNSEALADHVRAEMDGALIERYADRIRRVEVYLQDMNAQKGGDDIRCSIELHLAGLPPIAVDHRSPALDESVSGAFERLLHAVEHKVGKMEDRNAAPAKEDRI